MSEIRSRHVQPAATVDDGTDASRVGANSSGRRKLDKQAFHVEYEQANAAGAGMVDIYIRKDVVWKTLLALLAIIVAAYVAYQAYMSALRGPGFFCGRSNPTSGYGMGRGCWGQFCMADKGMNCHQVCEYYGGKCSTLIPEDDMKGSIESIIWKFGKCKHDSQVDWFAHDQPAYVEDANDPNHGRCLGYKHIPKTVDCSGAYHTTSRYCRCSGELACPM